MSKRYKGFRICCFVIAVALLGAMWFFSSQDAGESAKLSGGVTRFLMRLFGIDDNPANMLKMEHIVRKTAHFCLFALLGLSLGFAIAPPKRPVYVFWALPVAVVSAIADELHQTHVMGRGGMWQDSLLDSCGALTGILAAFVLLRVIARRMARKQSVGQE